MIKIDHERLNALQDYDIDIKTGELYLMGTQYQWVDEGLGDTGVEAQLANRFIRNINLVKTHNPENIIIHMQLIGGHVDPGWAIYDAIKLASIGWPTTLIAYGQASSMSSVILQAADERLLMPNTHVMIHQGSMGVHKDYTIKQVGANAEWLKFDDQRTLEIYRKRMQEAEHGEFFQAGDRKVDNFLRKMYNEKEDFYMTSEEAVHIGLADRIYEGDI